MTGYVYIMANDRNGTIYVGVTANLCRRTWQHQEGVGSQFTQKYALKKLVYYKFFENIENAIAEETKIKWWKRDWKLRLIEERNPQWKDLSHELV
ncbi:MAG: GIY-YIG nuclease family protein [Alphaproteobacteria bacterium]